MESESQAAETTSILAKQPSETDEKSSNSITISSETSSLSGSNSSSNGGNASFSNGPDEITIEQPIAKVSADEDDDDNEVGIGEDDVGEVVDISYAVESAPRVRVSKEEDSEDESIFEDAQEEGKVDDKGDNNEPLSSKIDENGAVDLGETEVEGAGDEVDGESDAIVDIISVDVGEAVRSGVAVVGVVEEEDSEVKPAGKDSAVADSTAGDSETIEEDSVKSADEGDSFEGSSAVVKSVAPAAEGPEEEEVEVGKEEMSVVQESTPLDSVTIEAQVVKPADEGDSLNIDTDEAARESVTIEAQVVKPADEGDSLNIDTDEAARESGASVVGEVAEKEELENTPAEVKEASPEKENSIVEDSASVDVIATETEVEKAIAEEDSVVEGIIVDATEVVRSGVAVVGDTGVEEKETEVKEVGAPVAENLALDNDFEPLAASNTSGLSSDLDIHIQSAEHEQNDGVANKAEMVHSQQNVEQENIENGYAENDYPSKEPDPVGEVEVVSAEDKKEQPDDMGDEPQVNAAAVGEETNNDSSSAGVLLDEQEVSASDKTAVRETVKPTEEIGEEAVEDRDYVVEDDDGDSDADVYTSRMVEELERASREASAVDQSERIDGEVVTDSEEEEEEGASDEEGEEKELFDSAALAALLKAASSAGSDPGTITITSPDGSRLFSVERPAGLGSSLRAVRPSARTSNSSFLTPPNLAPPSEENLSEEEKKKLQHIHDLRVKFLRLVDRLGHSAEDSIAAQVLYRLALLAGRPTSPAYSLDSAKQKAMQLEAEGKDNLDFSLNVLVLGKTGVGKSATINSIFGEQKVKISAFEPETTSVQVVDSIVDGVKIRIIDAPGLKCSGIEQGFNRKVLASVKKYTKKYPLDVMLYVDRLDSPARSLNDLPMLKTISSCLGSSIWRNAVVALTHASCAPPDGPSGSPLSYDVFVAQRSHIVQQSIGHATGDMRLMNPSLMNPVSLVENHPACRKNREGQKVLPNGQTWRPQLLLLCYSLKILSEASSASKPQDPFDHRKLFGFRSRAPPLPYLLSSLLQPHAHPKLSADQGGDNADSDVDLDDLSDSDQEEEDEYDQLPPFKPLRKFQMAKLSKEQRKAYFEEYDYRVRLLQKKQWREELKRMREMKKGGKVGVDEYGEMPEDFDAENGTPAAVPVPLPDMVLPPTFDGDNPAYRYRFLEPTSQFLARPVLDTHGWDHDCGYDGVNVEQNLGIAGRFPSTVSVQVTKDKKDFNIHLDSAVSAKHGETGSSLVGFDIQTIGKQLAYIVRGESKFKNMKKNKTAAGVSVTFLGENVATGIKLEDQIPVGKRLVLVGSAGTVRSQKDAAYGANLEVRLREADYPIGQDQSSVVLSLMKWRGDLAIGANLQSQFSVGRGSKMAVRVGLNNKLSGQISVRTSSSDHLQLALAGLIPIAVSIYRSLKPAVSENYSLY